MGPRPVLMAANWLKDSEIGPATHTRWYYTLCYQVKPSGGEWGILALQR